MYLQYNRITVRGYKTKQFEPSKHELYVYGEKSAMVKSGLLLLFGVFGSLQLLAIAQGETLQIAVIEMTLITFRIRIQRQCPPWS